MRELEYCVGSLARLGAEIAKQHEESRKEQLALKFVTESRVFASLTKARRILGDACDIALTGREKEGASDPTRIEELIGDVSFWSSYERP